MLKSVYRQRRFTVEFGFDNSHSLILNNSPQDKTIRADARQLAKLITVITIIILKELLQHQRNILRFIFTILPRLLPRWRVLGIN